MTCRPRISNNFIEFWFSIFYYILDSLLSRNSPIPKAIKDKPLVFYYFVNITVNDLLSWFSLFMIGSRRKVCIFTYVKITFNSIQMSKLVHHTQQSFAMRNVIFGNFCDIS